MSAGGNGGEQRAGVPQLQHFERYEGVYEAPEQIPAQLGGGDVAGAVGDAISDYVAPLFRRTAVLPLGLSSTIIVSSHTGAVASSLALSTLQQ